MWDAHAHRSGQVPGYEAQINAYMPEPWTGCKFASRRFDGSKVAATTAFRKSLRVSPPPRAVWLPRCLATNNASFGRDVTWFRLLRLLQARWLDIVELKIYKPEGGGEGSEVVAHG